MKKSHSFPFTSILVQLDFRKPGTASCTILLVFITILGACSASGPKIITAITATPTVTRLPASSTTTPTPTLFAIEATIPEPSGSKTPVPGAKNCLEIANDIAGQGVPCIRGTYNAHYDITTVDDPHQTEHTVSPLTAQFSLWAVQAGQLEGNAHLKYSLNATLIDTEAIGCKTQTSVVAPFEWDLQLKGQYFKQGDNRYFVNAQANPAQGPAYTEKFQDCPIPDRQEPGIAWSFPGGMLVNGVFDFSQSNPLPPNSTGDFTVVIHMELRQ
jgi:hypothetical protein